MSGPNMILYGVSPPKSFICEPLWDVLEVDVCKVDVLQEYVLWRMIPTNIPGGWQNLDVATTAVKVLWVPHLKLWGNDHMINKHWLDDDQVMMMITTTTHHHTNTCNTRSLPLLLNTLENSEYKV